MRQTNEQFISTLNRIHTNTQTKEDFQYLNRNLFQFAPIDPTFPYLFYRNKDVAIHNKKMLSIVPGDEIVIDAIDNLEETMAMSIAICIQQHCLYKLFSN